MLKIKRLIILIIPLLLLCGCEVKIIDPIKDRDEAIKECQDRGGEPFVENYNDSKKDPIVHCNFSKLED